MDIFEYVEKDVISVSQINLKTSLCDVLKLDKLNNPNTRSEIFIIILSILIGGGYYLAIRLKRKQINS